jgi:hypothetical protein
VASLLVAAGLGATCLAATCLAAATSDKPYPVYTPENFINSMKLAGRNFGAVSAAVNRKDFETAKSQLVRTRELLAVTITYWRDRNKADAIRILRDTLTKIDALDTALSAETVDSANATAIKQQIGADCQACHTLYREQDPRTKGFRFKAAPAP